MRFNVAAAALAAIAPTAALAADPADPAAVVPRMEYRSAFQDVPKGVEEGTLDWKKANAEVGQFTRGHADLLKWEERYGADPVAPAAGTAAPSGSSTPDRQAAPPAGHAH